MNEREEGEIVRCFFFNDQRSMHASRHERLRDASLLIVAARDPGRSAQRAALHCARAGAQLCNRITQLLHRALLPVSHGECAECAWSTQ